MTQDYLAVTKPLTAVFIMIPSNSNVTSLTKGTSFLLPTCTADSRILYRRRSAFYLSNGKFTVPLRFLMNDLLQRNIRNHTPL